MLDIIHECAKALELKFNIPNLIKNYSEIVEAQLLENQMPKLTTKEREKISLKDANSLVISEIGTRLFSGNFHDKNISPLVYELTKHNKFILKNIVNKSSVKIVDIGFMASGIILKDQAKMYKLNSKLESNFYQKILKSKLDFIQIKFSLPQIYLTLLHKGHIKEVQEGPLNKEVKNLIVKKQIDNL
jgi:aspartate--ammonia ligase